MSRKSFYRLFDKVAEEIKPYCTLTKGGEYGNATTGNIGEYNLYTLDIDPTICIKIHVNAYKDIFHVSVNCGNKYREKEWVNVPTVKTVMNYINRFVWEFR